MAIKVHCDNCNKIIELVPDQPHAAHELTKIITFPNAGFAVAGKTAHLTLRATWAKVPVSAADYVDLCNDCYKWAAGVLWGGGR